MTPGKYHQACGAPADNTRSRSRTIAVVDDAPAIELHGDDDTPTRPTGAIADAVFRGLNKHEGKRLNKHLLAWTRCTTEQRVILEAIAAEFAKVKT
jgi:hypothetical protein